MGLIVFKEIANSNGTDAVSKRCLQLKQEGRIELSVRSSAKSGIAARLQLAVKLGINRASENSGSQYDNKGCMQRCYTAVKYGI